MASRLDAIEQGWREIAVDPVEGVSSDVADVLDLVNVARAAANHRYVQRHTWNGTTYTVCPPCARARCLIAEALRPLLAPEGNQAAPGAELAEEAT